MLVSTEMPRETTSASDALEKPSNGLIVFVVDIHSPLRFRSLSVLGKAPAGSPGGFLTRLVACAINATTLPNPRQKPNTEFSRIYAIHESFGRRFLTLQGQTV